MSTTLDHKGPINLTDLAAETFRECPELHEKYEKKYGPWKRPLDNSTDQKVPHRVEHIKHSTP